MLHIVAEQITMPTYNWLLSANTNKQAVKELAYFLKLSKVSDEKIGEEEEEGTDIAKPSR